MRRYISVLIGIIAATSVGRAADDPHFTFSSVLRAFEHESRPPTPNELEKDWMSVALTINPKAIVDFDSYYHLDGVMPPAGSGAGFFSYYDVSRFRVVTDPFGRMAISVDQLTYNINAKKWLDEISNSETGTFQKTGAVLTVNTTYYNQCESQNECRLNAASRMLLCRKTITDLRKGCHRDINATETFTIKGFLPAPPNL